MVSLKKRFFLGGPKSRFWAQNSDFGHMTPILVNGPFVALGVTVHFPPWKRFFDFPFPSYSHFLKKIRLTRQKVFPLPAVGDRLPVTALVLSARRPFGAARFARGLDNPRHAILKHIFRTYLSSLVVSSSQPPGRVHKLEFIRE